MERYFSCYTQGSHINFLCESILSGIMIILFFLAGFLVFMPMTSTADVTDLKLTFETLACDGTKGFASVSADDIFKIEESKCPKGSKVSSVYQLLIPAKTKGHGDYDIFVTSEKEAKIIMKKIEAFQKTKQNLLESGKTVIFAE